MSHNPKLHLNEADALSTVFSHLQLSAEVYCNGDFCGAWAVDTSGSRRMPFHLLGHGQAWLHVEGQKPQALSAGDLLIFPHDLPHAISSGEEKPSDTHFAYLENSAVTTDNDTVTQMICGFFEFESKTAWPLLNSLAAIICINIDADETAPAIKSITQLMLTELDNRTPGSFTAINHLAYLLFIQIIRQQIALDKLNTGLLTALFDPKIGKALNAIHNYPQKRWTLETLASEAAMGRSSFAQRFNALTGMPPLQYLTAWRMQQAKKLLETSNLSLANIAEQFAYESETAFRKAFKKVIGTPPGELRRRS